MQRTSNFQKDIVDMLEDAKQKVINGEFDTMALTMASTKSGEFILTEYDGYAWCEILTGIEILKRKLIDEFLATQDEPETIH